MYIFTAKNILFAGIFYEVVGVLLVVLGFVARVCKHNNGQFSASILKILSCIKMAINENNFVAFSVVVIISTFFLAKFGKVIEGAVINHGLFSVDTVVTVLICAFLAIVFFVRYKIGLIYQAEKAKENSESEENISDEKLILSVGVVVFFSGVIAQLFGT